MCFLSSQRMYCEKPKGQQQIERAVLETSGVNVDDQHRTDIAYVLMFDGVITHVFVLRW